jgi:hypothetical protein
LSWNYLTSPAYWAVNLVEAKIGNSESLVASKFFVTIVDSGTSYIMMPLPDHAMLKKTLKVYGIDFNSVV